MPRLQFIIKKFLFQLGSPRNLRYCLRSSFIIIIKITIYFQATACAIITTVSGVLGRALTFSLAPDNLAISSDLSVSDTETIGYHIGALSVLLVCVHIVGAWTSFLMERSRREAFLESRECVRARIRQERENYNQVGFIHY